MKKLIIILFAITVSSVGSYAFTLRVNDYLNGSIYQPSGYFYHQITSNLPTGSMMYCFEIQKGGNSNGSNIAIHAIYNNCSDYVNVDQFGTSTPNQKIDSGYRSKNVGHCPYHPGNGLYFMTYDGFVDGTGYVWIMMWW